MRCPGLGGPTKPLAIDVQSAALVEDDGFIHLCVFNDIEAGKNWSSFPVANRQATTPEGRYLAMVEVSTKR